MAKIADQTLNNITLFTLNCSLFHGNRKVSAADIHSALNVTIDLDKTKDVMSLGIKRVFDKKELSRLTAVKGAMHRACATVGTPFLNGFAVPGNKAQELAEELNELVQRGLGIKDDLMARYKDILDQYAKSKPNWAHIIKGNAFDESYVSGQINFDWDAVRIAAADEGGIMSKGLESKVGGLLGNLLTDIAKAADRLYTESLFGKTGVTRKAFRPLQSMADKLDGFRFMDPRVGALSEMIRHVVSVMPDEGRIEGADLRNLVGLAVILSDPDKALTIGQRVCDTDVNATFDLEFGSPYVGQQSDLVAPMTSDVVHEDIGLKEFMNASTSGGPAAGPIHGYKAPETPNVFGM